MAKRSNFKRRKSDKYYTPYAAVIPLLPYLTPGTRFAELCAGDGRLVAHLERSGMVCTGKMDIDPHCLFIREGNALTDQLPACDAIITNPPWTRELMHPMIERFMRHAPTWLLFDASWKHTKQSIPYLRHCSHIVNVGRVKWIENTSQNGKDDACWYRFDIRHVDGPRYYNEGK